MPGYKRPGERLGRALVLGALLLAACGGADRAPSEEPPSASPPPVVLIGWDGASWNLVDPLLERGMMPNLAALVARGSRGTLLAEPPLVSPAAWTTLATGFPADEHGVTAFTLPDPAGGPPILAASFHRRRAALWQMISARSSLRVGVIGWWTTWPAEEVRGYIVSDHLAVNRWDAWARRPPGSRLDLTYPDELAAELQSAAVSADAIPESTLTALVPFDDRERAELAAARAPVMFHAPSVFKFAYATDASNMNFARHMLATEAQPDLFGVVFILSDVAGHVFLQHYIPEAFPDGGSDARLRGALPNVYGQLDTWLGELLASLDPQSRIVLLSDHGMRSSGRLPEPGVNPAGTHSPEGLVVLAGPGLPAGIDLGTVSVVDVVPSVLALLGLPLAADMPGRPFPPVLEALEGPPSWIESYGDAGGRRGETGESTAEDAYLERLRSLGYIQ